MKGGDVMTQKWSKIGDGSQNRVTISNPDGSTRTVDERADGGITVTDTNKEGHSVSGEGARGVWSGLSGACRLNDTPGKL